MLGIFLQGASIDFDPTSAAATGGLMALIAGMIIAFIVIGILLWVYLSIAFMAIGKKARVKSPGLAWIPGFGSAIIAWKASKMPGWPWWLILGLLLFIIPIAGLILGGICMLVFYVYVFIWSWKMFEAIGRPGWWAIVPLGGIIPIIGFLFGIAYLILIGIAAWGGKK